MQQTLPEWLRWLVAGGAGTVAFGLIELLQKWPSFAKTWSNIPQEVNRIIAFAIAGLLGGLAFWAQVQLGYEAPPGELAIWFERLFAIVMSQIVYSGYELARKRRMART